MRADNHTGKAIENVAAMLNNAISPKDLSSILRKSALKLSLYGLGDECCNSGVAKELAEQVYYLNELADVLSGE